MDFKEINEAIVPGLSLKKFLKTKYYYYRFFPHETSMP